MKWGEVWRGFLPLVLAVGCSTEKTPPTQQSETTAPVVEVVAPVVESPTASAAEASPEVDPPPAEKENQSKKGDTVPARRLVVFTPSGPLLMDFQLRIGGASLKKQLAQFANEALTLIDVDEDGRASWAELMESPLARETGDNRADQRRWRENYDYDGDQIIDPIEILAWLDRSGNANPPGLRLISGRAFAPKPASSPLWRTLDTNQDGDLDTAEISASSTALLHRDVNDDLLIDTAELFTLEDLVRERAEADTTSLRSGYGAAASHRAALLIDRPQDALIARDALALLRKTGSQAFGPFDYVFEQLDQDGDKRLTKLEWRGLQKIESALEMHVVLSDSDLAQLPELRCTATDAAPWIDIEELNPGWMIRLPASPHGPGGELIVSAVDEVGAVDSPRLENAESDNGAKLALNLNYTRIAIVANDADNGLLTLLDSDRDGRLGEQEIAQAPESLVKLDHNGDGSISEEEAPWRMRLTLFRTQRQLAENEAPQLDAGKRNTDAPIWFRGVDSNGDGVVSRSEFLGPLDRFGSLDVDQDGFLSLSEMEASETNN